MDAMTILNNVKFAYDYSDNQSDLFTAYHVRYKCIIKHNGKQYTFDYQCNERNNPTLKDCLYCLILDMMSAENALDVDDFLKEFGYTDNLETVRKGEKAYKECVKTGKALRRLFDDDEIEVLDEYFQNY